MTLFGVLEASSLPCSVFSGLSCHWPDGEVRSVARTRLSASRKRGARDERTQS
jgi:hypothetical protein